jgi:hypothetical protein
MLLAFFEDPAATGFGLLQFGIAGAALGVTFAIVVRPLIAASIVQQARALDLLEKSVTSNTEAVELFRRYESLNTTRQERILEVQQRQLELIAKLEEGRATR